MGYDDWFRYVYRRILVGFVLEFEFEVLWDNSKDKKMLSFDGAMFSLNRALLFKTEFPSKKHVQKVSDSHDQD